MSKASERKEKLHESLILHAEKRIAHDGVGKLRARDLAADAGCSVGAIYNVFDDLDALILNVSLRTLQAIDKAMQRAGELHGTESAIDRMVQLAATYHQFVLENTNLWRALFEHELSADYPYPDWVLDGQRILFRHIEEPLKHHMPNAKHEQLVLTARSLFGAVHGIVTLSVDGRTSGIKQETVPVQLEFLLRTFVIGLSADQRA